MSQTIFLLACTLFYSGFVFDVESIRGPEDLFVDENRDLVVFLGLYFRNATWRFLVLIN